MNRFFALGCVLVAAFCCCITTSAQAQWTTAAPTASSVPVPGLPTGPIFPGGLPSSTGPFYPGYDNSTCTPSWNATIPICNGTTSTGPFFSAEWNTTSCQYECQPYTCYSHQSCLSNPSWYGCDGETYQCSSTLYTSFDSWSGRRSTQCYTGCAYLPMCEPTYNTTIPTCSYGGSGSNFTISDNGTMVATGPKWNTTSCQYECQNITCPDQDRCERDNWCGYSSNPPLQCVSRLYFYQRDYRRSWKSSVCSTGCEAIPLPPLANDTCIPSWNTTMQNSTNAWNSSVTIIPNCNSSTSGPFSGLEWNTTSCQYECQSISCPNHQRCEQQGWCNYNSYYYGRPQMCSTQVYTTGAYQRPWLTSQCSTGCVDRPYNLTCKPDANTPLPSCATNATQTINGTWVASGVEWNTTSCQYECVDKICLSHESCERGNWCGSVPGASCSSQVVTYDTNNWYQPWKISQCNTGCKYEPVCLPSYNTTYPYNVTCNITLSNNNITNTNGSRSFSVNRWNTTTCSYECELLTCPAPSYCYCGFGYTCEATITTSYYGTNSSYVIIPRCGTTCVAKPRPAGFPTFNPYEDRSALITNGYYASYISSAKNATNDMNIPYQNQERTYTMWIKSYNYYYNYNYYWQPEQVFFGMTKNNTNSSTYSCWYNNTTNAAGDEDLVIGRTSYGEFFARTCRNYISIGAADYGDSYGYQWIHVAFVYRPASRTAQLFVNGYTNGPQYWSYALNTSRERVVLGANPVANSYSSNFQGEIGRMNFYRFALTPEAIYSDVTYGVVSSPSSRWGPVTYNGFPQYGNLANRNQTFTLYGSYVRLSWNETNWNSSSSTGPYWPTPTPSSTGGNNGNNTYNCAQHTDCLSCLTSNCGWCSTMGRCVAGSNTRSDNGICTLAAGTWSWNYEHCFSNGTTTTPPTTRPPTITTRPPTITTRPPTTRPPSTTQPPTKPAPTTPAPTTPAPAVPTTFNWTSLSERTWSHPFKSSISFTYNNPPHNVPLYVRVQGRSKLITQGTTSSSIQVTADVDLKGKQQLTSMTVEILRDDQDGIPIAADHIYTQVVTRSAISRVAIPEQILNAMANGEDATLSMQPCPPTTNTGAIVGGVVAAMTALIILTNIATHVITKRHQQKVQSAPAPAAPVTETWQANPAVASTEGVIVVV